MTHDALPILMTVRQQLKVLAVGLAEAQRQLELALLGDGACSHATVIDVTTAGAGTRRLLCADCNQQITLAEKSPAAAIEEGLNHGSTDPSVR